MGLGWFEEKIAGGADLLFAVSVVVSDDFGEFEVNEDGAARHVHLELFAVESEALFLEVKFLGALLELFLAKEPMGDFTQLSGREVGRSGQLEEMVFERGSGAGVEYLRVLTGTFGEESGEFAVFADGGGQVAAVEPTEGRFVGMDAESFRRRSGDHLDDFVGGVDFEPAKDSVLGVGRKFVDDGG